MNEYPSTDHLEDPRIKELYVRCVLGQRNLESPLLHCNTNYGRLPCRTHNITVYFYGSFIYYVMRSVR